MTNLSEAELQSLHDEMRKLSGSGAAGSSAPAAAIARGRSAADAARARIEDAAPALLAALEDTLSARTHRPWALQVVATRVETAAEIVISVAAPSIGVCPDVSLVIIDQDVARRLVTLLLGLDGDEADTGTMGALDHHAIARVLRGVADDIGTALATFLGRGAPRAAMIESGWRTGARHLGAAAVTLAVELEEPIRGRLVVAVPLASLERAQSVGGVQDAAGADDEPMRAHLADIEVQIAVELGSVSMPLGALAELAAGTILPLSTTESTPLPVFVEGARRFTCRPQAVEDGRVLVTLLDQEAP